MYLSRSPSHRLTAITFLTHNFHVTFVSHDSIQVWKALLSESATLAAVPSYRFDLVDVTREFLEANFSAAAGEFRTACAAKKDATCVAKGERLLEILDDFDAILSSDVNFMLGLSHRPLSCGSH